MSKELRSKVETVITILASIGIITVVFCFGIIMLCLVVVRGYKQE
jgi:hypothetical protein